jgi:hypothetical protein
MGIRENFRRNWRFQLISWWWMITTAFWIISLSFPFQNFLLWNLPLYLFLLLVITSINVNAQCYICTAVSSPYVGINSANATDDYTSSHSHWFQLLFFRFTYAACDCYQQLRQFDTGRCNTVQPQWLLQPITTVPSQNYEKNQWKSKP